MAILLVLPNRAIVVLSELVATPYKIDLLSRCRDPPLGLLLEDVEHVDHAWKFTVYTAR